MKRLLCIVGRMDTGGAETFLMKLYRAVDCSEYQFDFCVSKDGEGHYDKEILSRGGRILKTVAKSKNPIKSFLSIKTIVQTNQYEYVLRVSQHSLSALELVAARLGGAKRTVFRSSNSKVMGGEVEFLLHKTFRFLPSTVADIKIAPSKIAAVFMFGRKAVHNGKVIILNNAIDTGLFKFDADIRGEMRKSLGINNEFAVCHIGRFSTQKNHHYLVNVFAELHKKKPEALLFLVGKGELEEEVKNQVVRLGLNNHVRFMGIRSDIPQLLMAMDVMVFPSFYEGMPNAVIEAQATGLHCVISDSITQEAAITDKVDYMSLSATPEEWADKTLSYAVPYNREGMQKIFIEKGYDIASVAKKFCDAVFE